MEDLCKKCLLLEAGEKALYNSVREYLDNLDDEMKAEEAICKKRLEFCKRCDELISGMCKKCGCYVEIRAALKDKNCPNFDDRKW